VPLRRKCLDLFCNARGGCWPISEMAVARVGGRLLGRSCRHCGIRATGATYALPQGNYPKTAAEGPRLPWPHRRAPHEPRGEGQGGRCQRYGDGRRGGAGRDPGLRGEVLTVEGPRVASSEPAGAPEAGACSWASAVALRVVWCRSPRPRVDDGPGRRLSGAPVPEVGRGSGRVTAIFLSPSVTCVIRRRLWLRHSGGLVSYRRQPHGGDMTDQSDDLNTLRGGHSRGFTGVILAAVVIVGAFMIIQYYSP
jgi:hypothetical protein